MDPTIKVPSTAKNKVTLMRVVIFKRASMMENSTFD